MKSIRLTVCGAGRRGKEICDRVFALMQDVDVVGIADLSLERANSVADLMLEKTGNRPHIYASYQEMFDAEKPDAVFVASSWETHKDITIAAFNRGIAVALEVGGAFDEAEWFALIDAYEKTKTPFMFMENCCFGRNELLAASLKRNGVFGEVVYCHGAYMHDIRKLVTHDGGEAGNFRLFKHRDHNCDYYPTHELGPIAKLLDINRGNRMVSLTSRASKARGLADYIDRNADVSHLRGMEFKQGDIVETLITCENGELISIRLDTSLPCYYSRELTVRGTRGMYEEKLGLVLADGWRDTYETQAQLLADAENSRKKYEEKYLPEMWKQVSENMAQAGHGGIDYLQFEAFFDALRYGRKMPIDVYDAASWMSVAYLSEKSIALGGASVEIPDFTRGSYKNRKPRDVVPLPVVPQEEKKCFL